MERGIDQIVVFSHGDDRRVRVEAGNDRVLQLDFEAAGRFFAGAAYIRPKDSDVIERTVVFVGGNVLDGIDDFESVNDLAEDRILSVQMRRAAHRLIDFPHFRCELNPAVGAPVEPFLDLVQSCVVKDLAPDNVELHG